MWKSSVLRPKGVELARTEAFTGMTAFARASVFAFRSLDAPSARIGWLANLLPFGAVGTALLAEAAAVWRALLRELLHTMPLDP
jgi:P-type Ca2+ transporter type 2C